MAIGILAGLSGAAKLLFSGEAKQARQERKEAKKEAKEAAKHAKATAKALISGGSTTGAVAGTLLSRIKLFIEKNWQYILIVGGSVLIIWFMFFRKRRRNPGRRRRRSGGLVRRITRGKGSAYMRRKMARVRAGKKRKRK